LKTVERGTLASLLGGHRRFDAITLLNVLEHMSRSTFRWLASGGRRSHRSPAICGPRTMSTSSLRGLLLACWRPNSARKPALLGAAPLSKLRASGTSAGRPVPWEHLPRGRTTLAVAPC
jgi:hypothetical protein